jgi:hypothetical protein
MLSLDALVIPSPYAVVAAAKEELARCNTAPYITVVRH